MKISKVLIAYDGSNCADEAIEDLRRAGLPERAYAIVMVVIEDWLCEPLSVEHLELLAQGASARINSLMHGWSVEPLVSFGSAASAIIDKADEWLTDLIIVGSHGRGAVGRTFFGSVSQKVAHEARCAVRVARCNPVESGAPVRLVVGFDGSMGAEAAIGAVAERRWPRGSEARIVSASWKILVSPSRKTLSHSAELGACENSGAERMVEAAAEKLQAAGITTSVVTEDEEPKRLLLSEAESWDADSIFVGARGLGGIGRCLLGSVSSAVAARAHCSVEIVR
jgi:nucleotide-binding universal stress UspA family protein